MAAQSNQKIPEPYQWVIRPVSPPDPDQEKELDPWDILEFLRIEALLRSPKIRELFNANAEYHAEMEKFQGQNISSYPNTLHMKDKLYLEYQVVDGWRVLAGSHHRLLSLESMTYTFTSTDEADNQQEISDELTIFRSNSGLLNIRPFYRAQKGFSRQGAFIEKNDLDEKKDLEQMILDKNPRYLWVRIDTAYPPTRIMQALKKELEDRHKCQDVPNAQVGNTVAVFDPSSRVTNFVPSHPSKSPPIQSLNTWLNYFKCYDLHQAEGKSYGQIANLIYQDSKKVDLAKKAYRRVGKLIHYAETHNWPPPTRFLNSK